MYSLVMMLAMNGGAGEAPQFHKPERDFTPYVIVPGCCGGSCCGGAPARTGCCGGTPFVYGGCGGCCGGYPTNWGYGSAYQTTWSPACPPAVVWQSPCAVTVSGCVGVPTETIVVPGSPVSPAPPKAEEKPAPKTEDKKDPPKKIQTLHSFEPNLIRSDVTLLMPAGAKLYVNDSRNAIPTPDGRFETPALPAGQEYAYIFKAVVEIDGVRSELARRVTFRAGDAVRVDLRESGLARNDGGR